MITEPDTILVLNRMLQGAEESAYAAELELAAAQAEVLQLREAMEGQRRLIDALNHNAVLAHEAHRRVVAERDALAGRLMGAVALWAPEGSRN